MTDSLLIETALKRIIPRDKTPVLTYGDLVPHSDEISLLLQKVSEYGHFYAPDPTADTLGPRHPTVNWLVCNTRRLVSAIYSKPHVFSLTDPRLVQWLQDHKFDYPAQRALGDAISRQLLWELLPPGSAFPATHRGAWELLQPFQTTLGRPYPPGSSGDPSEALPTTPVGRPPLEALGPSADIDPWTFPGDDSDWILAHFGPLYLWEPRVTVAQRFKDYAPYRNALVHLKQPSWAHIPKLIQLLLIALGESQGHTTGWSKWGLLWTDEGLFFDYNRALNTALVIPYYRRYFDHTPAEHLLNLWRSPLYYSEKSAFLKGMRLETFTEVYPDQNYALIRALRCFERFGYTPTPSGKLVPTQLETDEEFELRLQAEEDAESSSRPKTYLNLDNACLFKVKGGAANLTEYLKFLDKGHEGKGPVVSRATKHTSPYSIVAKAKYTSREVTPAFHHHIIKRSFTLNAFELGWTKELGPATVTPLPTPVSTSEALLTRHEENDARLAAAFEDVPVEVATPDKITLHITKYGDTYYISPPTEIFEAFPELADRRMWIHREGKLMGYKDEATHVNYALQNIGRWHKHENRKASIRPKGHELTYFHADVLQYPTGLFWKVLDLVGATNPTKMAALAGPRTAFRSFVYWLHDPVGAATILESAPHLAPKISVGDELLLLCKSTFDAEKYPGAFPSPIDLDTLSARLAFFYSKALSQMPQKRLFVADTKEDGAVELKSINNSDHARQMTDYDKWVVWYVLNMELPKFNRQFNRVQIAKYITLRWMPWRRAGGLMLYLKGAGGRVGYDTSKARLPPKATDLEVARWAENPDEVYALTGLGNPYSSRY